jgi:hypothetical protein
MSTKEKTSKKATAKQAQANRSASVRNEKAPQPMSTRQARAKGKKAPAKKPTSKKASDSRLHASKIENPVAVMWDICEKMKNKRRRDVLKAATDAGIAFWTARTQYQLWSQASRASH